MAATVRCNTGIARRLDRAPAHRRGRRVPREGDRLPQGHGRARPLWQALPRVRHGDSAHPLRGERNELLPAVSDRRQAARRPLAFPAAQGRLAEDDRGAGKSAKVTEPSTMNGPLAPRRAAFAFVFVTVLLDMFAIGIIIPVLPRLVEDFMGGDTARAAMIYGVFGTAWALMQFLFSPVLGSLSDRF